jgi:hypothetical protein
MFMAFLLASSWLPASKKRIERIRSGAGDGESAGINRTQENRLAVVGLFASYPWGPCSSRRSSRAPSWTSARCRRPWLSTLAPTKKRIWEGLGWVWFAPAGVAWPPPPRSLVYLIEEEGTGSVVCGHRSGPSVGPPSDLYWRLFFAKNTESIASLLFSV